MAEFRQGRWAAEIDGDFVVFIILPRSPWAHAGDSRRCPMDDLPGAQAGLGRRVSSCHPVLPEEGR